MDSTAGDDSASDESATEDGDNGVQQDEGTYTPQPDALRRQQFFFAIVGSLLGGAALAVSLIQQYPAYRLLWIFAGGLAGILLFRLISGSIFPGERENGKKTEGSDGDEDSGGNTAGEPSDEPPDSGTSTE